MKHKQTSFAPDLKATPQAQRLPMRAMQKLALVLSIALLMGIVWVIPVNAQAAPNFFRGINFGGDAVTIDGNAWLANTATTSNVTMNGTAGCNPWMEFSPAVSGSLKLMLSCWREHWAHDIVMASVPNGTYQVYLYVLQSWDNTGATPYNILLEDSQVVTYNPGTEEGVWARLGPYRVNIADGNLNLTTNGGTTVLSGIEIWSGDGSIPAAETTATQSPNTSAVIPTLAPSIAQSIRSGTIPQNIRDSLTAGGVNLTFGFYDTQSYDPHAFDGELPLIAEAGARHVRIPISLDIIEEGTTGRLRNERYQDIVDFVNRAREYGLVTIIDVHNVGQWRSDGFWEEDYMGGLRDEAVRVRHITLMTEFVGRLYQDGIDRSWFVFQPANEPIFTEDPQVWYSHQAELLPLMRQACPDCVFFVMSHDWQGVEATVENLDPSQPPYNDPLLIFDVHFYEPLGLTHCRDQDGEDNCPRVVWPGNFSTWRGNGYWDRVYVSELLQILWDWKNRYDVLVNFSEVGTTSEIDETVRAAYLGDLVGLIRQNGAGYSMYDWQGRFGIKQHPAVVRAAFTPQ